MFRTEREHVTDSQRSPLAKHRAEHFPGGLNTVWTLTPKEGTSKRKQLSNSNAMKKKARSRTEELGVEE